MKKTLVLVLIFGLLLGCQKSKNTNASTTSSTGSKPKTVVVKKQKVSTELFYSGRVEPISSMPVTAPFDGVVVALHFTYGSFVKENQILFTVKSAKLQQVYRDRLTEFLTTKNTYNNSLISFHGTEILYKKKIVDKQSYMTEHSTVEANRLSFENARAKLLQTVKLIPGFSEDIEKLTLHNFDQVQKTLNKRFDQLVVRTKVTGVALLPEAKDGDSKKESRAIKVGSQVKKGETMVSVGNLSGISVPISVNEVDINLIKKGQAVKVSFSALPGIVFAGVVSSVGAQAIADSRSRGLATFPVIVSVPKVETDSDEVIRVGITAKVEIDVGFGERITLPIEAVYERGNKDYVKVINHKTRQLKEVRVETGRTNRGEVVITKGLKPGDEILVAN